jgi:chemotaxis protein CheD
MVLGVGDLGASAQPGAIVKTYALGSCIAVVVLDKKTRCVGMVHVALPDSATSPEKAKGLPGYFADTGIPALFDAMRKVAGGVLSPPADLIVKICGGANIADKNNVFDIGKRNALAIKKILWKYGLTPKAEDCGGNYPRTVAVHQANGLVELSSPNKPNWKL